MAKKKPTAKKAAKKTTRKTTKKAASRKKAPAKKKPTAKKAAKPRPPIRYYRLKTTYEGDFECIEIASRSAKTATEYKSTDPITGEPIGDGSTVKLGPFTLTGYVDSYVGAIEHARKEIREARDATFAEAMGTRTHATVYRAYALGKAFGIGGAA